MTQEFALWAAGIAATIIGCLALLVLNGVKKEVQDVKKQGADTNQKVTDAAAAFARLEETVVHLTKDVRSLNDWRSRVQERALEVAEQRAREAERRHGPLDRREAVNE